MQPQTCMVLPFIILFAIFICAFCGKKNRKQLYEEKREKKPAEIVTNGKETKLTEKQTEKKKRKKTEGCLCEI